MVKRKKKIAMICLILATFFNPLGFDILFALVMSWTKSYLITDIIFYCISMSFFFLYWIISKENSKEKWAVVTITKRHLLPNIHWYKLELLWSNISQIQLTMHLLMMKFKKRDWKFAIVAKNQNLLWVCIDVKYAHVSWMQNQHW